MRDIAGHMFLFYGTLRATTMLPTMLTLLKVKGSNIYTDGKGVTRYSPLSDWSHEAILAFIHYHKVPVPPIYEWQNGYSCGTHPWPARQWTGSVENGWKEVFEIDGRIVIDAAKTIPSAREFLEKNGK